jgi:prephenate dehydrogenase
MEIVKPDSTPLADKLGPVAILGVGLIGGSIGLALRNRNAAKSVVGWDMDRSALQAAVVRGAIDEAADTAAEAVKQASIVVLATSNAAAIGLLREIRPSLPPDAIVTDVGSTKRSIVAAADNLLHGRFVGGHPMAGAETSGIGAALSTLFVGAVWALTPSQETEEDTYDRVVALVKAVDAIPYRCSASEHDRAVAYLSHLPHVLAYGLAYTGGEAVPEDLKGLAAGSFRDGTRVSQSRADLWTEILLDNSGPVIESLEGFVRWIEAARQAIGSGDREALAALLSEARRARGRFPR